MTSKSLRQVKSYLTYFVLKILDFAFFSTAGWLLGFSVMIPKEFGVCHVFIRFFLHDSMNFMNLNR